MLVRNGVAAITAILLVGSSAWAKSEVRIPRSVAGDKGLAGGLTC